jgi:hypothetical protein
MATPWAAIVGGVLGAVSGGISTFMQGEEAEDNYDDQSAMLEAKYQYGVQYNDASFDLQRKQTLQNLNVQKNRLAETFGADLSHFNLGVQNQAFQNQQDQLALADSTGSALAAQATSGTKGSNTLAMRVQAAQDNFNDQLAMQDQNNIAALQNTARQYSYQFDDIGRQMEDWESGGYYVRQKGLQDTYNAQLHDLEMQGLKNAYADATPTFMDYMNNILGGSLQGASAGSGVGGMLGQMGSKS